MEVSVQVESLDVPVDSVNETQAIIKVEQIEEQVPCPSASGLQFQRGVCYTSFEEFLRTLSEYQQQNHVFFVRESAERLKFEPTLMERLVYKNVIFVCKQGRNKRKPTARGIRPNQTSFKVGCKAFVRVGLKQQVTGEYVLEVKSSRLEHNNHPVSAENATRYPENRRVSVNDKIKDLIKQPSVKCREVIEYIKNDQAKLLSPRDLYNLKRKIQAQESPCDSFPSKPSPSSKQKKLKPDERMRMLEPLLCKGWSMCADKDAIQKEFIFSNFNEAFRFITGIGLESNKMGHYPEWHNYNSKVGIILQTQSVSAVTAKDVKLANYIESLAM